MATSAGAAFGLTLRVAQRAGTKFPIVDADLQTGLVGPVVAVTLALAGDRYVGIGIGAGYTLFYFHLPFYLCEAFAMAILLAMARTRPRASARLAMLLPFRFHDLIFFPPPGFALSWSSSANSRSSCGSSRRQTARWATVRPMRAICCTSG